VVHLRTSLILGALTGSAAAADVVEGGLLVGHPAVLETGLTTGVAAGFALGGALTGGARLGWSTATEFTSTRTITQDELRLRLHGGLAGGAGVGTAGLRLGLGGTAVHEVATRNQGARAGLQGSDLEQTTWRLVPGGELEALVTLRVWEDFGVVISGGPALHLADGAHFGFVGGLCVAWLP